MRFRIAKPSNHMSFGNLFYTNPSKESERRAMRELQFICAEKMDKRMLEQLNRELDAIEETNNATGTLIMYEIGELSKELGYPVMLYGMESGLYIMEVLGVSGVHLDDYERSETPSEMCIAEMLFKPYTFTLGIAEPVREHIQKRLDARFGNWESDTETYKCIDLPNWEALEQIGKLSKATNGPISEPIKCDMWIFDKLYTEMNNDHAYGASGPLSPLIIARQYAFERCNHKDDVLFSDVKNYVFRDSVYEALRGAGAVKPEALRLARNSSRGKKKKEDLFFLEQYDLPENLFYCYKVLGNLWSMTSCLSRVNVHALLLYYKRMHTEVYKQIVENNN